MPKVSDLTGQRFGRLVALEATERRATSGSVIWRCRCDCGSECFVSAVKLKSGWTESCGCLKRESIARIRSERLGYVEGTCLESLRRKTNSNNSSGIKGVSYDAASKKWNARITFKGKTHELGRFADLASAAEARKKAERMIFDPFLDEHGQEPLSNGKEAEG